MFSNVDYWPVVNTGLILIVLVLIVALILRIHRAAEFFTELNALRLRIDVLERTCDEFLSHRDRPKREKDG
jgi:hypothetical protein